MTAKHDPGTIIGFLTVMTCSAILTSGEMSNIYADMTQKQLRATCRQAILEKWPPQTLSQQLADVGFSVVVGKETMCAVKKICSPIIMTYFETEIRVMIQVRDGKVVEFRDFRFGKAM